MKKLILILLFMLIGTQARADEVYFDYDDSIVTDDDTADIVDECTFDIDSGEITLVNYDVEDNIQPYESPKVKSTKQYHHRKRIGNTYVRRHKEGTVLTIKKNKCKSVKITKAKKRNLEYSGQDIL